MENQVKFLDRIFEWANTNSTVMERAEEIMDMMRGDDENVNDANFNFNSNDEGRKVRPTTATTRTRPFSAYSRPISGVSRGNKISATGPQVSALGPRLMIEEF